MANGSLHSVGMESLHMQFQGILVYLPIGLLLYTQVSGMITPLIYGDGAQGNSTKNFVVCVETQIMCICSKSRTPLELTVSPNHSPIR